MKEVFSRFSATAVLAAIGGGLASALLSMLTAQKTTLAITMGCVSPLPLMLAALSFGAGPGFIAVVVGSLVVGLVDVRQNGLAFFQGDNMGAAGMDSLVYALSLALPAWWLARVAAQVRPTSAGPPTADQRKLGLIVASAALFAVVGVAIDFTVAIVGHGGFQATMDLMTRRIEPFIQALFTADHPLPKGIAIHDLAVAMTWAQMPVLAAAAMVLLGVNIWAAGRIVQSSGRFKTPWPDLPRNLRVPRALALAFAVALGLSFAGGLPGMVALIATGALTMAFALQGLAVVHDVTRGKSVRLPLLIIVYLTLILLMPWLLAVYAVVGLCDAGLSFRDRGRAAASAKS